jgi:hypothetical protein
VSFLLENCGEGDRARNLSVAAGEVSRTMPLVLPGEARVILWRQRRAWVCVDERRPESHIISARCESGDRKAHPVESADRRIIVPLKKGANQSVISSNIKTLVDDWKKEGSIGTSHPPTKKRAIRQAVAIALTKAGKSRNM